MIEQTPPDTTADGSTNVHSAAPSQLPPSTASEVAEPPQDEETIAALKEDIERDHLPQIGAMA